MSTRRSATRPMSGASAFRCSDRRRCRWRRAASSPNGTQRRSTSQCSGAAKLPFFNRRALAGMTGTAGNGGRLYRVRCRRRLRRPRRILSRGFSRRLRGAPVRPSDQMGRGPPRAFHGDRPCPRSRLPRSRSRCRRDGTILGMRGDHVCRYRRLCAAERHDAGAQRRAVPRRPLSDCQHPTSTAHGCRQQQDADRHVSRPGRFEGCFFCERLLDIAARDLGIDRLEIRRRNLLTDEEMPYPLATVAAERRLRRERMRQRRLPRDVRSLPARIRLGRKEARLHGNLIDGRYHGLGIGCFIEGGASGPRENARMAFEADGTVSTSMSARRRSAKGSKP